MVQEKNQLEFSWQLPRVGDKKKLIFEGAKFFDKKI